MAVYPLSRRRMKTKKFRKKEIKLDDFGMKKMTISDRQMRNFLTIFLIRNLPSYTWLERASVTEWEEFWDVAYDAFVQIKAMKN